MSFPVLLGASLPSHCWGEENNFSEKSSSHQPPFHLLCSTSYQQGRHREAWVGEKGNVDAGSTDLLPFNKVLWEGVWFLILRMCDT